MLRKDWYKDSRRLAPELRSLFQHGFHADDWLNHQEKDEIAKTHGGYTSYAQREAESFISFHLFLIDDLFELAQDNTAST